MSHPLRFRHFAYLLPLALLVSIGAANVEDDSKAAPTPEQIPRKENDPPLDPTRAALADIATMDVGRLDWPQWGGWSGRNNTPLGKNIPANWDVGEFDDETFAWTKGSGRNIKWVAELGSSGYSTPVVAGGRVFLGTNNAAARVKRFPEDVDLGCLLCFRESDGAFLWQHSNRKLASGKVNDWGYQGVCSTPYVSGNRLWYVSNHCEVVCLDVEGFRDDENDGPYKTEESEAQDEADVVWKFDMIDRLGVFPRNMSSCSVTCAGDILFVNTSNGLSYSRLRPRTASKALASSPWIATPASFSGRTARPASSCYTGSGRRRPSRSWVGFHR